VWTFDGTLISELKLPATWSNPNSFATFSPSGKYIVTVNVNDEPILWATDGTLVTSRSPSLN
jgi:hypothetical protein